MKRLLSRGHVDLVGLPPNETLAENHQSNDLVVAPLKEIIQKNWQSGSVLIFVGAIGAVVRMISPFIKCKETDPAVLVLDSEAKNIVPILGAHNAGAEKIALNISEDLGGNAVLTGFSATNLLLPLDSYGYVWGWKRSKEFLQWKKLMISQSRGEKISFSQDAGSKLWETSKAASTTLIPFDSQSCRQEKPSFYIGSNSFDGCSWHPPVLWVGVGCERNTSKNLLKKALEDSFDRSGLAKESIAGFATIDLKANEPALISLSESEEMPINFFSREELRKVSVPNPSSLVHREVGTASVAEAASLLSAGKGGILKLEKTIFHSDRDNQGAVTIAIAQSVKPFAPGRGELHVVGSGPGDLSLLTCDARFALSKSAVWIGYKRYLDLLEPLRRKDQTRIDGELTFEKQRCAQALELALEGTCVSLISSGESGIYGMAGLALELLLQLPEKDRPNFDVHPGISAFQLAAAKVGAPLMNDFCSISLSDCLPPWEKIEARLEAASIADFVIALYNPKSKARYWQLERAFELLLKHRSAETPVLLARQVGRKDEKIEIHQLGSFPIDQVDMLSILLIGNTMSVVQDGLFLTPRGY